MGDTDELVAADVWSMPLSSSTVPVFLKLKQTPNKQHVPWVVYNHEQVFHASGPFVPLTVYAPQITGDAGSPSYLIDMIAVSHRPIDSGLYRWIRSEARYSPQRPQPEVDCVAPCCWFYVLFCLSNSWVIQQV